MNRTRLGLESGQLRSAWPETRISAPYSKDDHRFDPQLAQERTANPRPGNLYVIIGVLDGSRHVGSVPMGHDIWPAGVLRFNTHRRDAGSHTAPLLSLPVESYLFMRYTVIATIPKGNVATASRRQRRMVRAELSRIARTIPINSPQNLRSRTDPLTSPHANIPNDHHYP